jgi:outer membrane protein OmpA-like peptidoglycan-associated protein
MALSGAAVAASFLVTAALPAAAQDYETRAALIQNRGPYIGGGVGANFMSDNDYRGNGSDSKAKYDPGIAALLSGGYAFGNGLRLELEPGYRYNDVEAKNGLTGRLQQFGVMANAIYDVPLPTFGIPVLPHIGAGVGWARVYDHSGPHGIAGGTSGHDDAIAYQAIAGVDYSLSPGLKLGLDYRYHVADGVDFKTATGLTSHVGAVQSHTALVTFRYELGRPAPPPQQQAPPPATLPAVPAPRVEEPSRAPQTYTAYFDFDRADLTPDANSVVVQAAANARQGRATRILVVGHADTAGASRYNDRLSQRRAETVRQALVAAGVPATEIEARGVGETDLAVPTPDGVREPRNRRVVIEPQRAGT